MDDVLTYVRHQKAKIPLVSNIARDASRETLPNYLGPDQADSHSQQTGHSATCSHFGHLVDGEAKRLQGGTHGMAENSKREGRGGKRKEREEGRGVKV